MSFQIEKYSQEIIDKINYKYSIEFKSMIVIAKEVKLNRATIAKIIKYNGIKIRPRNSKIAIIECDNQKFNKLFIQKTYQSTDVTIGRMATCLCDCGNIVELPLARVVNDRQKSCGCLLYEGGKLKGYYAQVRNGAKDRNLEFILTEDEMYDILVEQNFKCKLTNIDLYLPKCHRSCGTASLDRIDSSKGYIKGNVQWVHKDINIMKWHFSEEEFINWCSLVVNHKKG